MKPVVVGAAVGLGLCAIAAAVASVTGASQQLLNWLLFACIMAGGFVAAHVGLREFDSTENDGARGRTLPRDLPR